MSFFKFRRAQSSRIFENSTEIMLIGITDNLSNFPNFLLRVFTGKNGLVIDGGGTVAQGSTIKHSNWNSSTNLEWKIIPANRKNYKFINRANGLVLDGGSKSKLRGFMPLSSLTGRIAAFFAKKYRLSMVFEEK